VPINKAGLIETKTESNPFSMAADVPKTKKIDSLQD